MADYFTNFSLMLPLPSEAAQQYAADLAERALYSHLGNETLPDDFPASLREVLEDWVFETAPNDASQGWGLWLRSNSGGIDAVCAFIQHLLQKFDPSGRITFEWSHDCSKPRADAYGGGAALITAGKIETTNTGEWLHQQLASLQQPQIEGPKCLLELEVRANDQTGVWEIHDESGLLCQVESESTAALMAHVVNVLRQVVEALESAEPSVEYHHDHEGCPVTLKTVRDAIQKAKHINPRRDSPAPK